MADYFTQFSCILDVGTAENAARAEEIRNQFILELGQNEGIEPGFFMQRNHEHGPGALWLHSAGHGEPEHVIQFVLRCCEALELTGLWGFCWALTCSKPRLDGFGGAPN